LTNETNEERRSRDVFAYCLAHWPALGRYVPVEALALARRIAGSDGVCTHADAAAPDFVNSRGFEKFLSDLPVPDGFFWAGIQNRGGSEYVFAMWRVGTRRFWFYDQYVVYMCQSDASHELTATHLAEALGRWDTGTEDVAFSGPWGFRKRPEERMYKEPPS